MRGSRNYRDTEGFAHRGDGHLRGFFLVIRQELGKTVGLNQMLGAQVRRRRKVRLDMEVAVSDGGRPSTKAAVRHKPRRGVEVDTVFPEVMEDQPEGLHASHP